MDFIIKNSNGKYVAYPGQQSSYTRDPLNARRFATLQQAQADCCGNEWPVSLWDLIR
jgi:hypothetical protein